MKKVLRDQLLAGHKPVGTFLNQFGSAAIEIMAYAGMDYIIIDAEHGFYDMESVVQLLRTAKGANISALVRIPEPTREWILRVLDAGAAGLVIPDIRTMDQIKTIVRYGKYPPKGQRGYAPVRAARYGTGLSAEKIQKEANQNILLFPQCETVEALELLHEIVATEGIDGLFVGPYDLSSSMGRIGQFDHPEFVDAIAKIQAICEEHDKYSLIFAPDAKSANHYFTQGYNSVAVGLDFSVLLSSYRDLRSQIDA